MNKLSFDNIRLIFLYLLVFLLGYEYWDEFRLFGGMTITKLVGVIYFLLCIATPKVFLRTPRSNWKELILLFSLWCWLVTSSLLNHVVNANAINLHLSFIQIVILFWLISNEISSSETTKNNVILFFILGVFSIYILVLLGIGIQSSRDGDELASLEGVRRVWFMGMNPNSLGNLAALSFLLTLGIVFDSRNNSFFRSILVLPLISFPLLISLSGSAGAFIGLSVGVMVYFLLWQSSVLTKTTFVIASSMIFFFFFAHNAGLDAIYNKAIHGLTTGDMSGRTSLWLSAIDIINDSVFFGTGGTTGVSKEFSKAGYYYDTAHNAYIDIFLWGGIISFMLFVSFQLSLIKKAYYNKNSDPLYLAILVVLTIILLKSGGALTAKYIWVLFALCCLKSDEL